MLQKIRAQLIKLLLGKKLTVFIRQKETDYYQVEVADSRKRVKILEAPMVKMVDSMFWVLIRPPFSLDEYARNLLEEKRKQIGHNP